MEQSKKTFTSGIVLFVLFMSEIIRALSIFSLPDLKKGHFVTGISKPAPESGCVAECFKS